MRVYGWAVSQLWIFGILLLKCSIIPKTNPIKTRIHGHMETCCITPRRANVPKIKPKLQPRTTVLISMLYVFEDNEAVTKMIIKGRSPTMRHVSRTHRVALDWLFDTMNLDLKIRYIDTKHQIADILTQGNFTCDEWNILLHLFNISLFSSLCCVPRVSV